jgi:signal transduction histidine kinase/phage shock protein PspC (stress-responsive transcriptional regulator)
MIGHRARHRPGRIRTWLTLSSTDRVLAGVAGGMGQRLGVDPLVLRLSFVVLSFAGGFGVLLYVAAWLTASQSGQVSRGAPAVEGSPVGQTVAVGLVVTGILLLLRQVGLWFGDGLVWPVAVAAFGSAIIWARSGEAGKERLSRMAARLPRDSLQSIFTGQVSRGRVVAGGLLVVGGMGTFLAANHALAAIGQVAVAVVVTVTGLMLLVGPLIWRLGRQLVDERRQRIRSEERAELVAHLHDSVLQTLAMIQRTFDPAEMAGLARGQERELRAWLYGRAPSSSNGSPTLGVALDAAAGRLERLHHVRIQTVVVGDRALDSRLQAMVHAAAEAMTNAAKHSGASTISVYAEAGPEHVNLYVRDEGAGFDVDATPDGRRGVRDSIIGRMKRNGGTATIASGPGTGTEVHLRLPRASS